MTAISAVELAAMRAVALIGLRVTFNAQWFNIKPMFALVTFIMMIMLCLIGTFGAFLGISDGEFAVSNSVINCAPGKSLESVLLSIVALFVGGVNPAFLGIVPPFSGSSVVSLALFGCKKSLFSSFPGGFTGLGFKIIFPARFIALLTLPRKTIRPAGIFIKASHFWLKLLTLGAKLFTHFSPGVDVPYKHYTPIRLLVQL